MALIVFAAIFTYFAIAAENFATPLSISNIATFAAFQGIVVVGVAILMLSGEFDLSVGSTFAVASFVFGWFLVNGYNPLFALLMALVVSAGLGLINGLIVAFTGIPSFITTLGTLLAYRGIARAIGGGNRITYRDEPIALFDWLNADIAWLNERFSPVANFRVSILWFIAVALVANYVIKRTRYGNWVFSVGGGQAAARSQGVPVRRVIIVNFVITGLLAGFASTIQFAWRLSVDPLRGDGLELVAVAAAVIGGVKLTGGYGTILGAVLGILLLRTLEQGLVLMGVDITIFRAIAGLILIVAVVINTYLSKET